MALEDARRGGCQRAIADADDGRAFVRLRADPGDQGRRRFLHGHHGRDDHVVGAVGKPLVECRQCEIGLDAECRPHLQRSRLRCHRQYLRGAGSAQDSVRDHEVGELGAGVFADHGDHGLRASKARFVGCDVLGGFGPERKVRRRAQRKQGGDESGDHSDSPRSSRTCRTRRRRRAYRRRRHSRRTSGSRTRSGSGCRGCRRRKCLGFRSCQVSIDFRVVQHGMKSRETRPRRLERNGYSGRTLAGEMPNIRLKVREKCAESAKPPANAASVNVPPAT